MRVVKSFTVLMLVLSILLVMTGCGTKGYRADVNFQQGDITYCLEDVVRVSEKDTDTTKAYAVSLLIYGDALPLSWNMNTGYVSVGIRMTLNGKDEEFAYSEVSFDAAEYTGDVDALGVLRILEAAAAKIVSAPYTM